MTTDQIDLARRLAAHPRFEWRAGMRYYWCDDPDRVQECEPGRLRTDGSLVPDLADAATAGILVSLLPYEPRIERVDDRARTPVTLWCVGPRGGGPHHQGETLGEAAARAWLAAQEVQP